MHIDEAIDLIQQGVEKGHQQRWADLGCGSGLFTRALASLLLPGSLIYAIDKDLSSFRADHKQVEIKKLEADMTAPLPVQNLDGIMMANSLHFVQDKEQFLHSITITLKPNHRLLFVEYDTLKSNAWVPYPIDLSSLQELLGKMNYAMKPLQRVRSRYQVGGIYSALAVR